MYGFRVSLDVERVIPRSVLFIFIHHLLPKWGEGEKKCRKEIFKYLRNMLPILFHIVLVQVLAKCYLTIESDFLLWAIISSPLNEEGLGYLFLINFIGWNSIVFKNCRTTDLEILLRVHCLENMRDSCLVVTQMKYIIFLWTWKSINRQ